MGAVRGKSTGLARGVVLVGCHECDFMSEVALVREGNPSKHLAEQGVAEVSAFVSPLMREVAARVDDVWVLELCHSQVLLARVHRGVRTWWRLGGSPAMTARRRV